MRQLLVIATILATVGCSTGPSASGPEAAQKQKASSEAAAQTVPPSRDTPTSASNDKLTAFLLGTSTDEQGPDADAPREVVDPATGQKQLKILKKARGYYAENGVIRNQVLSDRFSVPILREDAEAWYVAAATPDPRTPEEIEAARQKKQATEREAAAAEFASELEEVHPALSPVRLRLEEVSTGLPTAGFWRQNFTLVDLDGDGRLEIVAPPPRLTAGMVRAFKLADGAWKAVPLEFDFPEGTSFEYGGVAAADMNGDGKVDLVTVGHGPEGGPKVGYNEGKLRFRVESKGLPRTISARGVALGDLDGDGRVDIVAISDMPTRPGQSDGQAAKALADAAAKDSSFVPGYDLRAFMQQPDGSFKENHVGLDAACFGYAVEVWAKPPDGGEPIIATDCRYVGGSMVVYGYDKKSDSFHRVGVDFGEFRAIHGGVGLGLYKGNPAAFVGYTKTGPQDMATKIDGAGVSIYYRESGEWKRKRVVKFLDTNAPLSQGVGVGDLDGDGLDDVVWADERHGRIRVFFQQYDGSFEELDPALEPTFVNRPTCLRVADVDGDGKKDIVLMYETATGLKSRAGGLRFFRNLGK